MKIKINGNEYELKQTIRALFLFEEITNKPFKVETTLDNYLYFYCLLLASNGDFMDWDSFIEALDNDPAILIQISKVLAKQQDIDKLLDDGGVEDADGKKKGWA